MSRAARALWTLAVLGVFGLGTSSVLARHAAAAEGNLNVGVFLINWLDDTAQVITPEVAYDEMFVDARSPAAFYADASYGQMTVTGDVLGWYTVNYPKGTSCPASAWAQDAREQAVARGIDPYAYDIRVYMWTSAGCGYSGYTAGNDLYINYIYTSPGHLLQHVIAHEMGHVIGFGHAGTYQCQDKNGVQVSLPLNKGDTCETWTYADRYDVMGNSSYYTPNAIHRTQAGWLPVSDTLVVTTAGTYTLTPLEWSSGIRQIEVVPPKQASNYPWHLCLEVRQSYGWDQFNETAQFGNHHWAVEGVHVHYAPSCLTDNDGTLGSGRTRIIDATPNSPYLGSGPNTLDYPLPIGQTLVGPGVTITTLAIGPSGATVQVSYPKGNR